MAAAVAPITSAVAARADIPVCLDEVPFPAVILELILDRSTSKKHLRCKRTLNPVGQLPLQYDPLSPDIFCSVDSDVAIVMWDSVMLAPTPAGFHVYVDSNILRSVDNLSQPDLTCVIDLPKPCAV